MDGFKNEETNSTKNTQEAPQTIILGKNGDDTDNSRPTTAPSTAAGGRWLSRLTGWSDTDNNTDEQQQLHYNAMGDESLRGCGTMRRCRRAEEDATNTEQDYAVLPNDPLATTDSFFFRPTDTTSPRGVRNHSNNNNNVFKAVRNRHAEVFGYRDAVAVVPPAVLQSFRNRYAALNYECVVHDDHDTIEYDLELQASTADHDDDDGAPQSSSRRTLSDFSTVSQSALVYEADGKRLMRLPRDQVRLVMDPDLDPGILAAVVDSNAAQEETKEALEYVLTVDDDLYRRMVAEMATEQFVCVTEAGFCDIRIALGVLSVIFVVLFVNSLAFHEI